MPSYTAKDLQAVAPAVLAKLRALADFPRQGTVAGQSVASMFLEALGHEIRGQVNDIDVFVSMGMPRADRGLEPLDPNLPYQQSNRRIGTSLHFNDVSSETDYGHVKFIALRSSVNILRTYRAGMVNYTLISSPLIPHGAPGHNDAVSQAIVNGFDLNLVGVGINLETGQVVSSPGFLEFLNTGRIRVETCNTPAHTLVRLAKKTFGGEVMGASCDYETERHLLEVALACQRSNEEDANNTPHRLWTVLTFGAHYKKLHDRFSQVLPPLSERVETLPDGRVYTFYDMIPGPMRHDCDQKLVELAHGPDALPYFCSQTVHVAQFPRIYELLHPERSLLSSAEIAERRAAFEKIQPDMSQAEMLHYMQAALGNESIRVKVEGLDDNDSATFFFNQACISDPDLVLRVLEYLEGATPQERQVIHCCAGLRADDVLELSHNRSGVWKRMLAKSGRAIVSEVANRQFEAYESCRAPLLREIFDWLDEMGPRGEEIYQSMVLCQPKDCDHGLFLRGVLGCFEPDERAPLAARLIRKSVPSWPDLTGAPPGAAAASLSIWDGLSLPPDKTAWSTAPREAMPILVELSCKRYRYNYVQDDKKARADEMFDRILPRLSGQDLQADNARLVRAMLTIRAGEKLVENLQERADLASITPTLSDLAEQWRETSDNASDSSGWVFPSLDQFQRDEDPWVNPFTATRAVAVALLESVILSTQAAPAVSSPRRPRF